MANISNGSSFGITKRQALFARMLAEGCSKNEILSIIWGSESVKNGSSARRRALREWQSWTSNEDIKKCYQAIIYAEMVSTVSRAVARLSAQIDDNNAWVAQNAAREILSRYGASIIGSDDSSTVRIVLDNMPELGEPDA